MRGLSWALFQREALQALRFVFGDGSYDMSDPQQFKQLCSVCFGIGIANTSNFEKRLWYIKRHLSYRFESRELLTRAHMSAQPCAWRRLRGFLAATLVLGEAAVGK